MIKISKTHHIFHPFSQEDISLSNKQKRNSKFLFLIPIFGVFIFYRVTYALKIKAAKNLSYSEHNVGFDFKQIIGAEPSSSSPSTSTKKGPSLVSQSSSEKGKEIEQKENVQSSSEKGKEIESDLPSNIYLKEKRNSVIQTLDEVVQQLLVTPGFVIADEFPTNRCHTGETVEQIQGTPLFRKEARAAARQYIDAFSYQAMIDNAHANPETSQHLLFKRIGHIFGLKGNIFGINPEGCCEDITAPFITSSFKDFVEKEISNLPSWLTSSAKWIQEELLNVITSDTFEDYDIPQISRDLQQENFPCLVAGGSGWDWHSTITGFVGNIGFICNRGAEAHAKRYGVELFSIKNREGFKFLELQDVFTRQKFNRKAFFGRPAMIHELNGTPIHFENMPVQESGNCTYRSVEAYLLVLLALAYAKDRHEENFYAALEDPEVLRAAFTHAQIVFDQWVHYDRTQAFKFLMNSKEEIFLRMRSSVMGTEVYRQMTNNENA